jgi:uncharacterized protein YrrD
MQFRDGTKVYTADGQTVGSIDRVVINPHTNQVSHVVVRQGVLFTEDKVVPTALIDMATADEVRLRPGVSDLDELPRFEETYYIPSNEATAGDYPAGTARPGYARPLYWYPPVGATWSGYYAGDYGYATPPYVAFTKQNIPEGTVGLKEGAKVISAEGEQVGHVERVFTDSEMHRATHLLVAEGWLFKEKRFIPVDWIRSVTEDDIDLSVSARVLERLPELQA